MNSCYINNRIDYICTNEHPFFFLKPNVVGVGRGLKIKRGFCTCEPCIIIFVERKVPTNCIPKQDLIPPIYKGISTDVIEGGNLSIDYSSVRVSNACNDITVNPFRKRIRPVLGGYSIGPAKVSGAGTMGCLVTDSHDNFILGCNHVLAEFNKLPLGTLILQPSTEDGGKSPKDAVAFLSEYVPIKIGGYNLVDAAIAKVMNKANVSSKIALLGPPKGVISPVYGLKVQKVGEATGLTKGKIIGVKTIYKIKVEGKDTMFANQIILSKMNENGDSGAVLLNEKNYAVGFITAGNKQISVANTMTDVLKSLNVLLVTN